MNWGLTNSQSCSKLSTSHKHGAFCRVEANSSPLQLQVNILGRASLIRWTSRPRRLCDSSGEPGKGRFASRRLT